MSDTNIFLQASRQKLRFPSPVGNLTTEDLWDVPLTTKAKAVSVENIGAPLLAKQHDLSKLRGESILVDSTEPSAELQQVNLQVAVLREVARIRQEENKAKTAAAARQSEKEELDDLIRDRERKELPIDELKKRREALG